MYWEGMDIKIRPIMIHYVYMGIIKLLMPKENTDDFNQKLAKIV